MEFASDLLERIRKQIGLEPASDDAFTLLHPTGNEHSVQFFFKNLPEEFLEFETWDKHNLFLCDLTAELDFDFALDEDGRFASLSLNGSTQSKSVEAVMDLRDDYLVTIYYFGDSKTSTRVNQQLIATERIFPCYLGAQILEQLICELDTITRVEYDFEQQQGAFMEPVILKGTINGPPAQTIYNQYLHSYKPYFNIKCICGHLTDDAQGNLVFHVYGMIQVDDCRLSDFMNIVKQLYLLLRMKYQNLVDKCVIRWESADGNKATRFTGNVIEIWLGKPVDKLDGLLRFLTRGDKSIQLFGISERVTRKLWSIKSIHVNTGAKVELELSANMLRIYLADRRSIPILDKIEDFLQKHVTIDLENLVY
ncbi:MAG: hypothetical protein MJE63_21550 [Proteobacteria bacterium]|nr:hypothetical protein [Pseudomonadota bacterium]